MLDQPPIQPERHPQIYRFSGMPEFKVGMEVRWRISPECPYKCEVCGRDFHHHSDERDQGLITGVDFSRPFCSKCGHRGNPAHGHGYFIEILANGDGFWAAAAELTLIEGEGPTYEIGVDLANGKNYSVTTYQESHP